MQEKMPEPSVETQLIQLPWPLNDLFGLDYIPAPLLENKKGMKVMEEASTKVLTGFNNEGKTQLVTSAANPTEEKIDNFEILSESLCDSSENHVFVEEEIEEHEDASEEKEENLDEQKQSQTPISKLPKEATPNQSNKRKKWRVKRELHKLKNRLTSNNSSKSSTNGKNDGSVASTKVHLVNNQETFSLTNSYEQSKDFSTIKAINQYSHEQQQFCESVDNESIETFQTSSAQTPCFVLEKQLYELKHDMEHQISNIKTQSAQISTNINHLEKEVNQTYEKLFNLLQELKLQNTNLFLTSDKLDILLQKKNILQNVIVEFESKLEENVVLEDQNHEPKREEKDEEVDSKVIDNEETECIIDNLEAQCAESVLTSISTQQQPSSSSSSLNFDPQTPLPPFYIHIEDLNNISLPSKTQLFSLHDQDNLQMVLHCLLQESLHLVQNKSQQIQWTPHSNGKISISYSYFKNSSHPNIPLIKASAKINNATPLQLVDLLMDSSRVKEYNKMSLGRKDLFTFQQKEKQQQQNHVYCCKVIKSSTKPPIINKTIDMTSLLYISLVPTDSNTQSYIVITRGIHESPNIEDIDKDHCHVLWNVNFIEALEKNHDTCQLTTITHVYSPDIPTNFIGKRLALNSAGNFIRDIQAAFKK